MNLLLTEWLPFKLSDGSEQKLPMSAICREDVLDFALPRADFQGAAYQFAIGVLQTVLAPEDEPEWLDVYEQPPREDVLQQAFDKVAHAFNATGDGPLFMQDFDELPEAKPVKVSGLLIEAPGANGLKLNTDHFVKRGIGEVMSLDMAVLALFTLQINAPSGGSGHRVGLRGGGPLTTLVLPQQPNATLWQKLWLNVINRELWDYPEPDFNDGSVFPWLASTRTSEKKSTEIYEHDVHPLHMYWAMPRRIRLVVENETTQCQISGETAGSAVREYRTQNYGGNYSGAWSHPLTPYKWDPKKPEGEPIPVKGQPGGITYKTWDVMTFSSEQQGQFCALAVSHFYQLTNMFLEGESRLPRLWAFGYDMDNMKARCWYSSSLPLFKLPAELQDDILRQIKDLQALTANALWHCRSQIKAAWFEKPSEAKGDTSFIDLAFWQRSENSFFKAVAELIDNAKDEQFILPPEQANTWLMALRNTCLDLFDEYALSDIGDQRSMGKRIKARHRLTGWLFGGKDIKAFMANHQIEANKELA
ncbi:type I-E CRISPR-associated protein Cse1/CasA [Thalassomonas viridans]|uniref:Type I-E CRISPR-associated protein Cse1/CasA n=1 Tax=Thalassomonas viridans TaxID=137584 RepID=A0AAE9Z2P3_9GAMM|nr:type I-E CRISPR-associated protein Cse1/CasA [Thalassomonas viridans]WDE04939.1 type I-E CRISPR-associated protein Cse1/CasA [Thalassomonas viridans]